MEKVCNDRFTPVLRPAFTLLLVCALLFGCAARSNSDALTDEDAAPETIAAKDAAATQTPPRSAIPPRPLQELLPDANAFAALFVNVGKADACILRFGSSAVLIDTGSAESVPQLIAGLNLLGVTKIDAVFITHSHGDHLGGLRALAANYDIPLLYSPFYSEANKDGEKKIVNRAENLNLKHKELRAGDVVPLAEGASLTVLGPLSLNEENDNDNSLVLRLDYGGKTMLFTGDMQFMEEQALLDAGVSLKSDVLKVGNHGNPDATGDLFAAQISPVIAVISTNSAEDEDSANPRVLAALNKAAVYVTEDFPLGVLLTLDAADNIVISNPAKEAASVSIAISFDIKSQSVTLTNHESGDADLSGCVLFSAETGAALRISDGTILKSGDNLTVGEGNSLSFPGDDSPLRKKKSNTVELFDSFGNLVGEQTD